MLLRSVSCKRLFRTPQASRLIKICNDFGAGGVCVAIGELAPGLKVNLDLVPKKYAGLDGTELAISESQERMAVVVDAADEDAFMQCAAKENLEATTVAVVTEEPRLVLSWRGKNIVDMSRAFLDTNGAPSYTKVVVEAAGGKGTGKFAGKGGESRILCRAGKERYERPSRFAVRRGWSRCLILRSELRRCLCPLAVRGR